MGTLERVFVLLPELIGKRWQCHSFTRIMHKLLHPGNSWKLCWDATRLFHLWYQALGEQAPDSLHNMFASLVPGFPQYSVEGQISNTATGSSHSSHGSSMDENMIHALLDDSVTDISSDSVDELLSYEGESYSRSSASEFDEKPTNFLVQEGRNGILYLPELRQVSQGCVDTDGKRRQDPLVPCRVALVKWVANYTHVLKREAPMHSNSYSARSITPGEDTDRFPDTELRRVSVSQVGSGTSIGGSHDGSMATSLDGPSKLGNWLLVDGQSQIVRIR